MRANRRLGFSLMEMMIVLLIVAIIAAASAPLVTKKLTRNGINESPWVFTGLGNNIAYNMSGQDATAIIGAGQAQGDSNPRLFIQTSDTNQPHISFNNSANPDNPIEMYAYTQALPSFNNFNGMNLSFSNKRAQNGAIVLGTTKTTNNNIQPNSIAIGNGIWAEAHSIAIGTLGENMYDSYYDQYTGARAERPYSIVIGSQARSNCSHGIAIGTNAYTDKGIVETNSAIAIGRGATASGQSAVAIGYQSKALYDGIWDTGPNGKSQCRGIAIGAEAMTNDKDAVAIGYLSSATAHGAVAIGPGAKASREYQVSIGSELSTVLIRGNLVVDGDVLLAGTKGKKVYLREAHPNANIMQFYGITSALGTRNIGQFPYGDSVTVGTEKRYSSDSRLKNVGEKYTAGLEELKKLDFFHYTFKKDENKTPRVGVMAQDLQKVFPDAVIKGEDGYLLIRTEDMFYAVINAVKELDSKISTLVEKVDSIVEDITTMKATIEAQQKTIDELKAQNEVMIKTNEKIMKRLEKLEKKKLSKVEE